MNCHYTVTEKGRRSLGLYVHSSVWLIFLSSADRVYVLKIFI